MKDGRLNGWPDFEPMYERNCKDVDQMKAIGPMWSMNMKIRSNEYELLDRCSLMEQMPRHMNR